MANKLFIALSFLVISLLVISGVLFIVAPEFTTLLATTLIISITTLLCLSIWKRKQLKLLLAKRQTRKAVASFITVILTLSIVFMFNFISKKINYKWDLTKTGIHSLSDQSSKVISTITKDVEMNFYSLRRDWNRFSHLLEMYSNLNPKIKLKLLDIEKEHLQVKSHGITDANTLELISNGRTYKKVIKSELDATNLFIKLLSVKTYHIYYTQGHGELSFDDTTGSGLSFLKTQILNSQYVLKPLDLMSVAQVPEDADLVLILSPQTGFLDTEINVLDKYIDKNKSVVTTLSPEFNGTKLSSYWILLNKLGVKVENALVLDRLSSTLGLDPSIVAINKLENHEVSYGISGRIVLPINAALSTIENDELEMSTIIKSSAFPASWGEMDLKSIESGKVFYNSTDMKGPIDLAYIIRRIEHESLSAVFASSSWITNQYSNQSNHFNLFLNTISYVLGDSSLVSLNRPSLPKEPILLSSQEVSLIFYFSVLFLPFSLFGLGIYFYQKRRRG